VLPATLNLDHMASEGMKFTEFYVTEHHPPLLFNVEADPGEKYNAAAEHPDIVADLMKLIEQEKATIKPGTVQK
jgi:arylsulfatase A-like enzyme